MLQCSYHERVDLAADSPVPGILIIAHAPLASALVSCAEHVYCSAPKRLEGLDVAADTDPSQILQQARSAIARLAHDDGEVLVLADAAGATPCNTARRLVFDAAGSARLRLIGGVNLPMLLRTLCYQHERLDDLIARAIEGGQRAIAEIEPAEPAGTDPSGLARVAQPPCAAAAPTPCRNSTC